MVFIFSLFERGGGVCLVGKGGFGLEFWFGVCLSGFEGGGR